MRLITHKSTLSIAWQTMNHITYIPVKKNWVCVCVCCLCVQILKIMCTVIKRRRKINSKCNYNDYVDINHSGYFTLMPQVLVAFSLTVLACIFVEACSAEGSFFVVLDCLRFSYLFLCNCIKFRSCLHSFVYFAKLWFSRIKR